MKTHQVLAQCMSRSSLSGFLLLAACFSACAVAQDSAPRRSLTPEEWQQYRSLDKLAEAQSILDDPGWHHNDAWIRYYREMDKDPARATPERTRGAIESRELIAIGTVINSEMPQDQKGMLLTKYLSHHNEAVQTQALIFLISSGIWSTDEAIAYIRQNDPTSRGWGLLLGYLPENVPASPRMEIAREMLLQAQREPPVEPFGHGSSLEGAVRELLRSADENDAALIRRAVRQDPRAPLLWAAVSRLPYDEATARLAKNVYDDLAEPAAVRFAATLVFAKDDVAIMESIASQIMDSVREFGSLEYKVFVQKRMANPAEPNGADRVRRAMKAEELLVVANELPSFAWRPHLDDLVRHPFSLIGSAVNTIAARRLPDEFIQAVGRLESIPEELDGPLSVALPRAPGLADNVRRFLPPLRFNLLREPGQEFRVESVLKQITLWE